MLVEVKRRQRGIFEAQKRLKEIMAFHPLITMLPDTADLRAYNFALHRNKGRVPRPIGAGAFTARLPERVPPIMDELIALRPDVIVAIGNSVTAAAQHATATIPIVMWSVADPVGNGLVSSLAHPGGNTTGARVSL
jgi:hypothetical protein